MVLSRKWVVKRRFQGEPRPDDFELVEEELPPLQDGEYLVRAEFISVDPYLRAYAAQQTPPYDQFSFQVGKVFESKSSKFPVGARVVSHAGWRDVALLHQDKAGLLDIAAYLAPDTGDLPISLCVGALGMPGATAYFGLLEVCRPARGETVVVSGAAGAVGSLVGQIAKIKGCRVVGLAGSAEKLRRLVDELGFDAAINYKDPDVADQLKKAAPDGIDCYFDNVGGELSSTIMAQMNLRGRVCVCGAISMYNEDTTPKATILQPTILFKRLTVVGFLVWDWLDRFSEAFSQLLEWQRQGDLRLPEHVTEGFQRLPEALLGMLRGENYGKAVVKV